jgi:hypothetical protein
MTLRILLRPRLLTGLIASAAALPATAHEKWFYHGDLPHADAHDLHHPSVAWAIGITVASVAVCYLLWRLRRRRDVIPGPEQLGASDFRRVDFYALVPAILGVHLAVPLLVSGATGHLFSPNNALSGTWRAWLSVAQVAIALCMFYGGLTRFAAIVLALVWLTGFHVVGVETMLENVHYLGFAAFFYLAGRGPFSIDRMLFPKLEPPSFEEDFAVPALRIGLGLSLIVVAFTEKLANLHMATEFLRQHPLNFTAALHIGMSDEPFAVCCGSVELVVGLMLL